MSDGPESGEDAARPERAPGDARWVAWGRREAGPEHSGKQGSYDQGEAGP